MQKSTKQSKSNGGAGGRSSKCNNRRDLNLVHRRRKEKFTREEQRELEAEQAA